MEAENYLADGYGIRLSFQSRSAGWTTLDRLARVWQPNRLKGIQVGREFGTPFMAATQVFDLRPMPRKWLSLDRTNNAENRFVKHGAILVTCSGSVGRATLAGKHLNGVLISHDLLRVEPHNADQAGWLYAFLRCRSARSMMVSARYGHIIKHLETSHLEPLPVPVVREAIAKDFQLAIGAVLRKRDRAHELTEEAEEFFTRTVGEPKNGNGGETGFDIRASQLMHGRRRLEASFSTPTVRSIKQQLRKFEPITLKDAGFDVWLPTRFKRIPAPEGVELMDSSAFFEISPDVTKRIADVDFGDPAQGRVKAGWLLLSRSGQTYGLIGSVALANVSHEGRVISDDIIRIAPGERVKIRTGYVHVFLSHPRFGRPLLKAIAYGSSIPHIEVEDVYKIEIPRLSAKVELALADLGEEVARLLAQADIDEAEAAQRADKLVQGFLAGETNDFVLVGNAGRPARPA